MESNGASRPFATALLGAAQLPADRQFSFTEINDQCISNFQPSSLGKKGAHLFDSDVGSDCQLHFRGTQTEREWQKMEVEWVLPFLSRAILDNFLKKNN